MSTTSTTRRTALDAANGRARTPAAPPQVDDFNAEAQRRGERGDLWFCEVPEGWKVKPLRAFLSPVSERNRPDEKLLSVTRDAGVIVRNTDSKEENHNYIPDDLSNYKFVAKGKFVINKMKAWQGSYGVSCYDGIVSPAYFVYSLDFPCKSFFNIAIRSKAYVQFFQRFSKGIRVDQWDLTPEALKTIPFAFPPLSEQEAIVRYLDETTGKIDKAIAAEERLIELLQERKQIIINEAVGGNLSRAEAQRRRGWSVVPLKFLCDCLDSRRVPVDASNRNPGPYPYWGAGSIQSYVDKYIFDEELVLLGEDGAPFFDVGRPVAHYVNEKVWINNHIHVLRVRKNLITPKFLANALNCADYKTFITGAILPKLTQANMNNIPIPLPPLSEQEAIVKYLDEETGKIDRAIEVKRRQIALLRERREIIIDEVVTGKVKVA